jgi:hypothetical protein
MKNGRFGPPVLHHHVQNMRRLAITAHDATQRQTAFKHGRDGSYPTRNVPIVLEDFSSHAKPAAFFGIREYHHSLFHRLPLFFRYRDNEAGRHNLKNSAQIVPAAVKRTRSSPEGNKRGFRGIRNAASCPMTPFVLTGSVLSAILTNSLWPKDSAHGHWIGLNGVVRWILQS